MPLQLYRRHAPSTGCRRAEYDRAFRRCHCPLWVEGSLNGQWVRKSLRMTDLSKAEALVAEWSEAGTPSISASCPSLLCAIDSFLASCVSRQLGFRTVRRYRSVLSTLLAWCQATGNISLVHLTASVANQFRSTWTSTSSSTLNVNLVILKIFFRYCIDQSWIKTNPVMSLRSARVRQCPTLPFSATDMLQILASCPNTRIRTFVLTMRYSGLRLADCYSLSLESLVDNSLFLYTAKTGTPVRVPIPPALVSALQSLPLFHNRYFFWNRISSVDRPFDANSTITKTLKKIFIKANISNGHSHRFRDTFAVELLMKGVPIEQVSILLGHSNILVTQKHYSPWVVARQTALESLVRATWE